MSTITDCPAGHLSPEAVDALTHGDRPRDGRIVGMAFLNQPIQQPELRIHVAALLDRPCFPQAILQLGHPAHPAKPTPRRPLADVVDAAHA